MQPSQTWQQQ
jgi:hypothetical protein